jgi:hypothetical protein
MVGAALVVVDELPAAAAREAGPQDRNDRHEADPPTGGRQTT